ncbi:MAG: response regulator transcription factor [Chloroflexota bacterium]|nr:response regulator transcription factor [Chloroflexota bacterium]
MRGISEPGTGLAVGREVIGQVVHPPGMEYYAMANQGARVLAVDDDALTCRLIEFLLHGEGYDVVTTDDPEEALLDIQQNRPDLLLLDVQLPRVDGFTLMRRLKQEYSDLPVIMLTARAEMQDRVTGLESGADDYVTKPFEPAELLARVKAVLRRSRRRHSPQETSSPLIESGWALDISSLSVTLPGGRTVSLTPTETRILHRLMATPNQVVSREDLSRFASGYVADTSNNQIDVYVGRIRRKLGEQGSSSQHIRTVRGSGYKFVTATEYDDNEQ